MAKQKFLKTFGIALLLTSCGLFFSKIYKNQTKQHDLTVIGFLNNSDGIGRQSIELIDILKNEFKVNFIATRKQNKTDIPRGFSKKFSAKEGAWGKVIIFEEMLWAPDDEFYLKMAKCDPQSIKFAYSMWESTKLPYEWVEILNNHFDGVLVPSHFLIDVYKASGVKIPIFELPLGRNMKNLLELPLKTECGYPMVFGNLSACSDRKNQIALVEAFAKAFGNDPSVLLRINCRAGEKEVKRAVTYAIERLKCTNIIFTQYSLSKQDYLNTLKNIDCYVSPSKGEGFSIQPREAMILGIPVIATNNTGQQEVCNSGLVRAVESPIEEIAIYPWGGCYGYNFNCTIDDLSDAMKEVKIHYDHYLSKGQDARKWAMQYEFDNLRELYRSIVSPNHVSLGEKNQVQADGIITNSSTLYEKYKKVFGI